MKDIWSIKYRPNKIADCILPPALEDVFTGVVESGTLQNMILAGDAGVGKTTVAKALCDELGLDSMFINASKDGDIDTLRTKIQQFASTVSMMGNGKVVILDEADHLTRATQPALRSFMEEFADNCRFILTANFLNKIIDPLQSRCHVITFQSQSKDKPMLAQKFMGSVCNILDTEGVEYDKKVVAEVIMKNFPDFRRTLNELQSYSIKNNKIDSGVLSRVVDAADVKVLIGYLKNQEFTEMRKWVGVHAADIEPQTLIRNLYDGMYNYLKKDYIPKAVLILAECQYRMGMCADSEIQLVASMTELMLECEYV